MGRPRALPTGWARDHHRVMPIRGVDHVQLAMPAGGEAAAAGFYHGLLGVPQVPKPAHLATRGGCWFESAEVKIHLGVEADFRPAGKAHPGLLVSDLASLVKALRAAAVDVVDDEPLAGYDRVYVRDPFGNRLELWTASFLMGVSAPGGPIGGSPAAGRQPGAGGGHDRGRVAGGMGLPISVTTRRRRCRRPGSRPRP